MRFSIEDRDVLSQFKDGGYAAPDQLIAAMLAFGPDQVLTTRQRIAHDEYTWDLLGLASAALCLVSAKAKDDPDRRDMPVLTDVRAEWVPLERVVGVSLVRVREAQEYYDQAKQVAADGTWAINIDGFAEPVMLPADPDGREGAVLEFAGNLLARRQQRRS